MTIKKVHFFFGFILLVGTPVVSGMTTYYTTIGDIKAEYAKRSDIEKIKDKIDRIAEDVAEIRGVLRQHH